MCFEHQEVLFRLEVLSVLRVLHETGKDEAVLRGLPQTAACPHLDLQLNGRQTRCERPEAAPEQRQGAPPGQSGEETQEAKAIAASFLILPTVGFLTIHKRTENQESSSHPHGDPSESSTTALVTVRVFGNRRTKGKARDKKE